MGSAIGGALSGALVGNAVGGDDGSLWETALGGLIGGYSGYQTDQASNKAINAQTNAANSSNQLQWNMYQQNRADQAPWMAAGASSIGAAQKMSETPFSYSSMTADPGYAFRLSEGQKAIDNAAARGGKMFSGQALKAAAAYNQDMGSQEYQNAYARNTDQFNRLTTLAGLGQNSTANVGAAGTTTAANVGNTTTSLGNAQAANYIQNANNINSSLSNAGNLWTQYSMGQNAGLWG